MSTCGHPGPGQCPAAAGSSSLTTSQRGPRGPAARAPADRAARPASGPHPVPNTGTQTQHHTPERSHRVGSTARPVTGCREGRTDLVGTTEPNLGRGLALRPRVRAHGPAPLGGPPAPTTWTRGPVSGSRPRPAAGTCGGHGLQPQFTGRAGPQSSRNRAGLRARQSRPEAGLPQGAAPGLSQGSSGNASLQHLYRHTKAPPVDQKTSVSPGAGACQHGADRRTAVTPLPDAT